METQAYQEDVQEHVVATMPRLVPISNEKEKEMVDSVSVIRQEAEEIAISNDAEYQNAADYCKTIKAKMDEVSGFFKPMKEAANKAHKAACDAEKQMLTPLKDAEAAIKKSMCSYLQEQEIKRKAAEEAIRKRMHEEADAALAAAAEHESNGDVDAAAQMLTEAEMMDGLSRGSAISASVAAPKAFGVSSGVDYEITSVDASLVPLTVSGIEIRPVDTKAVMRLIRASKGQINIPGIVFRAVPKVSIRR